jgi:hypothetical protein
MTGRKDGMCVPVSMVSGPVSVAGSRIAKFVIYRCVRRPVVDGATFEGFMGTGPCNSDRLRRFAVWSDNS